METENENQELPVFDDGPNEDVEIEITEDDVIIEGRSTKDLVKKIIMMENRMVQFVRLLVPEVGTLDDITYEDIDAEWPMPVQLEMIAKITESIQPGYKDSRKN